MDRKEEIIQFIRSQPAEHTFTTKHIADTFNIQRSNASSYLNELTTDGLLKKITGRPVQYTLPKNTRSNTHHRVRFSTNDTDVFSQVIGYNGSVKNAVTQGKASILYPPNGLNTLITGPTGSGKSFFANTMFQFAKHQGLIDEHKELQIFNCADYAKNPELLMSYLFGYTEGAFTGATNAKEGLIQKADGGMLFLDEVHRLPPEGQEMIFYFMDTGQYSRLGEADRKCSANVRMVCATTEDPKSTLLETFIRRIPINIHLPTFKERPTNEQIDLLQLMIGLEANRINRKISMTKDVMRTLIAHVDYGNIGQLKSNIQLICARGFMNQLHQEVITLTTNELPDNLKRSLVDLAHNRKSASELIRLLPPELTIGPHEVDIILEKDAYELPYNIYDVIADKALLLEEEQLDQETINQYISTDINLHLKSFYKDQGFLFQSTSKLADMVSKDIIDFTTQCLNTYHHQLTIQNFDGLLYAMSMHISSLIGKLTQGHTRKLNPRIKDMALNYPNELTIAKQIRLDIEQHFHLTIDYSEIYYLTILLTSFKEDLQKQVGVVVACHGNATASSMAQVAEELLDIAPIRAVDMPLSMSPKVAYEKVKEAVVQSNDGSGVLLLVDMGSLSTFYANIELETGIAVKCLDMISTGMVLEAARKANLMSTTLNELYQSLKRFSGYTHLDSPRHTHHLKEDIILAICASGEGTAKKIKELVEKPFSDKHKRPYRVIVSSIMDIKDKLPILTSRYNIVASTGIMDPKLPAPFIPLDTFINATSHQLKGLIYNQKTTTKASTVTKTLSEAYQLITDCIGEHYLFLNPEKVGPIIWRFVDQLNDYRVHTDQPYTFYVNLSLHLAGLIERLLTNSPIQTEHNLEVSLSNDTLQKIDHLILTFERELLLSLPTQEKQYIYYYVTKEPGDIESLDTFLNA